MKYRKLILFRQRKNLFYCESGQTRAWIAQGDRGVSILEDVQNLTELSPGQSAWGDPALLVGLDKLRKFLSILTTLILIPSVKESKTSSLQKGSGS